MSPVFAGICFHVAGFVSGLLPQSKLSGGIAALEDAKGRFAACGAVHLAQPTTAYRSKPALVLLRLKPGTPTGRERAVAKPSLGNSRQT
jgi:hypothetical protein